MGYVNVFAIPLTIHSLLLCRMNSRS
uniref:ORF10 protein n=1 Tax=Horseshoe bat sarbecovirus TaxID=3068538 RepID=A0AA51T7Z4_9BETC|nr:ORF10 protein [Horseshoe bat sarbecovirus]WMT59525.1 ORF10 protein [Horseshoe bat sarbecovirus]WMT59536.1 ORF10 protein [Horseshoe bat sarbecovirus]WMT59547.1 ORF10 protein [Horseshoe bat sarbecovirus]WMT59558.1 ORF10 protein [Horseshoe bat sarbecovirus]